MSTPQQRIHEATRRLLDLLSSGDPLSSEAVELRAELGEATAEAGHLEDAFYQVDELLKDAQREYGPDHENVTRAREVIAVVEQIARRSVEGV